MLILEVAEEVEWESRERFWISLLREQLTNHTDGGEGGLGFSPSEETRKKLSAIRKGKAKPPRGDEARRNISIARREFLSTNKGLEFKRKMATSSAKLSVEQVRLLRKEESCPQETKNKFHTRLGLKYGVHRRTVSDVLRGKTFCFV